MTLATGTRRVQGIGRIVLRVLGMVIGLTALAAFVEASHITHLEATWPALGGALEPLDQWRQLSALLLVAWAISLQFMLPETSPDRLAIRQGMADGDPRAAERRPKGWMLLWSTIFVAVWVGLLEVLSRIPLSAQGRVLLLAGAVVVQSAVVLWLLCYAGKRQRTLIETHWSEKQMQCPRAVRALLSPGVGFLLGVGTLGLWVGLLVAVSGAWPQMIGLPPAGEGHASLLAVMSLAADEALDSVLFGIPAQYGLVLGQSQSHSWAGATILVALRITVAVSLFLVLYQKIKARRTYAALIRQMLHESSEEASETLARIGRPAGGQLAAEAFRLRGRNKSDATASKAWTLLLQALYGFYHPRILDFALREAMNSESRDGDRVEALKYVCTYGDRQKALELLGQFYNSEDPALREGVSLICVAFEHPDCDKFLEEIGRYPHTPGQYKNAVIGAGLRLQADLGDSNGLNACLEALPGILHAGRADARKMLEGVSLLASFAAKEVKAEIEAAWPKMRGGTKLCGLKILLKIRAGLLPDPELLGRALSNTKSRSDRAGIGELWSFMTQAGVTSLVEIARGPDPRARDEALNALAQLQASRPDLRVPTLSPADMMAPAVEREPDAPPADVPEADDALEVDVPEVDSPEADVPEVEPAPLDMTPDPETHLVSL